MNEYLVFKVCGYYYAIISSLINKVEKFSGIKERKALNLREYFFDEKGGKYILHCGKKILIVDDVEGIFQLEKKNLNTIIFSNIVGGVTKFKDKLVIILSAKELFSYEK